MNWKLFYFLLIVPGIEVFSQQLDGQWKGQFIDKSSARGSFLGEKCDYVVELETNGKNISGSTYTYFTEGGKRYYTICKLEGSIDFKKKYVEIRETERIKTNIPSNVNNCLQIHKLTYFKKGNTETLEGNWVPAPNQTGNCGFGLTDLNKRSLINSYPGAYSKNNEKSDKKVSMPDNEKSETLSKNDIKPKKEVKKDYITQESEPVKKAEKKIDEPILFEREKPNPDDIAKLEKRKPNVIKTIEVESDHVSIDLYDNGEIDGDSVSLFYNNRLILSSKKLTDKPLHMILDIDDVVDVNELVMFAENLGSIPPNTALMVIKDGPNRYEVRITSDLEKSGVIRFVHKGGK